MTAIFKYLKDCYVEDRRGSKAISYDYCGNNWREITESITKAKSLSK